MTAYAYLRNERFTIQHGRSRRRCRLQIRTQVRDLRAGRAPSSTSSGFSDWADRLPSAGQTPHSGHSDAENASNNSLARWGPLSGRPLSTM